MFFLFFLSSLLNDHHGYYITIASSFISSLTYHVTCHDLMAVVSVIVTVVNIFEVGVGEVDPACSVVQCQAIGPVELRANDDSSHGSIHVSPLDPGVLTPIGPEHQVGTGRNDSVIRNLKGLLCLATGFSKAHRF